MVAPLEDGWIVVVVCSVCFVVTDDRLMGAFFRFDTGIVTSIGGRCGPPLDRPLFLVVVVIAVVGRAAAAAAIVALVVSGRSEGGSDEVVVAVVVTAAAPAATVVLIITIREFIVGL